MANVKNTKPEFSKWPKIFQFHNVMKEIVGNSAINKFVDGLKGSVTYRGKVKLHGTNAAIMLHNGEMFVQKRTDFITPDNDNAGFAKWAYANKDWLLRFNPSDWPTKVIHGEWCGSGVQKGDAISNIGRKVFVIFAVEFPFITGDESDRILITEPDRIRGCLSGIEDHDDIFILDWITDEIILPVYNRDKVEKFVENINELVNDIDECDPFVKDVFGVEGNGEGIVFYPIVPEMTNDFGEYKRFIFSTLGFKAKGLRHNTTSRKTPAQVDPEKLSAYEDFANMFVTEDRCEQAVKEGCDGVYQISYMSRFLAWIGRDIKEESVAEIEASDMEWKDVAKTVTAKAATWYKTKCFEF